MASDAAVVTSIALQYGVPLEVIRKALMRDAQGRASGPLGVALDTIAAEQECAPGASPKPAAGPTRNGATRRPTRGSRGYAACWPMMFPSSAHGASLTTHPPSLSRRCTRRNFF